jgi:hypothetical protein
VYKITDTDTTGILVAEVFDKTLLTVLLHAPAQAIIDKVLTSPHKKHHAADKDDNLQSYQSAFMKYLRKL